MKLYYSPGACSLSPHIVLREAGFDFELEKVDVRTKQTADGRDYRSINPKGYVPALELEDGQVLTEGAAIVQYLADRQPESKLAPPAGTMGRYRLMEWLNFIASELHKTFSPLFGQVSEEQRRTLVEKLETRFATAAHALRQHDYLLGDRYTVADAYLFVMLRWAEAKGIELAQWPELRAYRDRIAARPAVVAALEAESAGNKT